jgi:RimJ/RimL family protein N-acetyltransferase
MRGRITLRDGSTLAVRPIEPSDREGLASGFEKLSDESRYKRFFSPTPRLSDAQLRYLTDVDHHDHEALVAVADDGDGPGVARFVRLPDDPTAAEVAVAVRDDWQGRGVATGLLRALVERAREEGITRFTATALASNHAVIELLEEIGPAHVTPAPNATVELRVDLAPDPEDGSPLRRALRSAARELIAVRARVRDRPREDPT